jgi:hypothetical protein
MYTPQIPPLQWPGIALDLYSERLVTNCLTHGIPNSNLEGEQSQLFVLVFKGIKDVWIDSE